MSVTQLPDTHERLDLSEFEDARPPCEYSIHAEVGSGPATWMLWRKQGLSRPCGHSTSYKNPTLLCDACCQILTKARWFHCDCGHHWQVPVDWITRLERL